MTGEEMAAHADMMPLPSKAPAAGVSTAEGGHYKATVSNADGYMCHISVTCHFDVPPSVLFDIFTHADNSVAFRDITKVGFRKVLREVPGLKVVEVEQVGSMRIMWMERVFTTLLRVEEDSRDPNCLTTKFDLVRSDILARFQGAWKLMPVTDPVTGEVTGCRGELTQDVLPRGCPPFLASLPVLGGLLRGASLTTIKRLIEDMTALVARVRSSGKTVGEVIDDFAAERGHAHNHAGPNWGGNQAVASFRISEDGGDDSASEDGDVDVEDGCGAGDLHRSAHHQGAVLHGPRLTSGGGGGGPDAVPGGVDGKAPPAVAVAAGKGA